MAGFQANEKDLSKIYREVEIESILEVADSESSALKRSLIEEWLHLEVSTNSPAVHKNDGELGYASIGSILIKTW